MHRKLALEKYEEELRKLMAHMSFSKNIVEVTGELLDSIEQDRKTVDLSNDEGWRNEKEPYRIKVRFMIEKIRNSGNPNIADKKKIYESGSIHGRFASD